MQSLSNGASFELRRILEDTSRVRNPDCAEAKKLQGQATQWVVCAAIRSKTTGRVLCGARHMDVVMQQFMLTPNRKRAKEWKSVEQGFIDQFGKFMNRAEAFKIADKNGQILNLERATNGCLFSEDLY